MKKCILAIFAVLPFVLLPSASLASITRQSVERAWVNVFPYAEVDAPNGPIHMEGKDEPNAWVSSEGHGYSVHVTRGLLRVLNNEDEVAGVLGHELAHIKLGHFKTNRTTQVAVGILAAIVAHTVLDSNKDWMMLPIGVGAAMAEAGFSRQQEIDADDRGVKIAAAAGYDPWGLYRALDRMAKAGYATTPNGFNSHPPTERRLKHLYNTVEETTNSSKP